MHQHPDVAETLMYLFWEPRNWADFSEFVTHRAEVRRYAEMVQGAQVRFVAMTCRELWDGWALRPTPQWLAGHVARLYARYDVSI